MYSVILVYVLLLQSSFKLAACGGGAAGGGCSVAVYLSIDYASLL